MAYTGSDLEDAAREYARSGGNIAKTVAALRAESGLEKLSEATLRRMMKRATWAELVAKQGALLATARESATIQGERERQLNEMRGTLLERLAADETNLDSARKRLETVLAEGNVNLKPSQAIWAFESLAKITDRRREQVLLAVGGTREAEWLVESLQEAVVAVVGAGQAKQVVQQAKKLYKARIEAAQSEDVT